MARLAAAKIAGAGLARKRFCIVTYVLSAAVLLGLPGLNLAADRITGQFWGVGRLLWGVIAVWCLYHLLEFLANVALWAWLRDLVPVEHRGRFLGRRERWISAGRTIGMLASGLFAHHCKDLPEWKWAAYTLPAAAGAAILMLAPLPLAFMPAAGTAERVDHSAAGAEPFRWRSLLTPLLDARLSRLMIYGCWFSFFNGITQTAMAAFPERILGLSLLYVLELRTATSLGQSLVSPLLGRCTDRYGNRPVVMACQVIVGLALYGYLWATPDEPHWFDLAWVAFVAYAGINIGLPNLLLKLSPLGQTGSCVATYFALTGLCYGVSTILGGFVFDMLQGAAFIIGGQHMNRFGYLFFIGVVTRVAGVIFLWAVDEPRPAAVDNR